MIDRVAARVQQEWHEERAREVDTSTEDPLFELVHGKPGTGKSKVIAWIREVFVEILNWTHGNEFGFVILRRNLEAQTPRVSICVWGSGFGAETSNPKLFVCGVSVFDTKTQSPGRQNPGPPRASWGGTGWNLLGFE